MENILALLQTADENLKAAEKCLKEIEEKTDGALATKELVTALGQRHHDARENLRERKAFFITTLCEATIAAGIDTGHHELNLPRFHQIMLLTDTKKLYITHKPHFSTISKVDPSHLSLNGCSEAFFLFCTFLLGELRKFFSDTIPGQLDEAENLKKMIAELNEIAATA